MSTNSVTVIDWSTERKVSSMPTQRSTTLPGDAELHFTGIMSVHVTKMEVAAAQFSIFAQYLRRAARQEVFNENRERFRAYVLTSPNRAVCFEAHDEVTNYVIEAVMTMLESEFSITYDRARKMHTVHLYR